MENPHSKKAEMRLLTKNKIWLIDYMQSNTYDTKIALSESKFLVMNYYLGHSDFFTSTASIILLNNGKETLSQEGTVAEIEELYVHLKDSLDLNTRILSEIITRRNDQLTLNDFSKLTISEDDLSLDSLSGVISSQNYVKKRGRTLIHSSYSKKAITEIQIFSKKKTFSKITSKDQFIDSPTIELIDVSGDKKEELFIFYPSTDYWESESYELEIYSIDDFL